MSNKTISHIQKEAFLYSLASIAIFLLMAVIFFLQMGTIWLYITAQILYLLTFIVVFYFLTRKINWVGKYGTFMLTPDKTPLIILAYPVLREDEDTMHSTMLSLGKIDYPKDKYRVIAIPNSDDTFTIEALKRLQMEFPFLELMEVPPTADPSWNVVWQAWDGNPKAYWWHKGKTKGAHNLPPKKTRQLIYLFYTLVSKIGTDWVLDYIDCDSITPPSHFKLAAAGLQKYDVLQSTNVVGNLMDTYSTSLHSFDHMTWDGMLYPHMSANGKHPYYLLGKGLFYKARDLWDLGGFHPWITIEDPEVGIRLWANGKRLGIIEEPLIEEVPQNFITGGITQRNRWMCGFFQTMSSPLKDIGLKFGQRQLARLNMVPVMSLLINIIGIPTGIYAAYLFIQNSGILPFWVVFLSIINIIFYISLMIAIYSSIWKRTKLVLNKTGDRISYMVRINFIVLFFYWFLWAIPIIGGFIMFVTDKGKEWARTEKVDADRDIAEGQTLLKQQ
ncbi:MAG: glycosyltransferase family 2 protein [Dehalococcoidia bacterium]|jgi:cellulose synthase/poly-beta-1,6-N-acetylglucosamine synthase-like glycosyltransferase